MRVKNYCVAVLWALLLTPSFRFMSGIPALRVSDVLLLLAPLLFYVFRLRVVLDLRVLLIILIGFSYEIGLISGVLLGLEGSFLDKFFWIRLGVYIGAVIVASSLLQEFPNPRTALEWVISQLVWPTILLLLIVYQQYFNLLNLNSLYVPYVAPTQYDTLVAGYAWPRPVGMVGNPNELSFLLSVLAMSYIWMYLFSKENKLSWLFLGISVMVTSAVPLSRSAVFAGGFGILVMLILGVLNGVGVRGRSIVFKRSASFTIVAIATVISVSIYQFITNPVLYEAITWRFFPENYQSFEARVEGWDQSRTLWEKNRIFGVGPLSRSSSTQIAADNEWLLLLQIGGLFLACLFIVLVIVGLFPKVSIELKIFSVSLISAAFLVMVPASFFSSLVIMPLSLILFTCAGPKRWLVVRARSIGHL